MEVHLNKKKKLAEESVKVVNEMVAMVHSEGTSILILGAGSSKEFGQ